MGSVNVAREVVGVVRDVMVLARPDGSALVVPPEPGACGCGVIAAFLVSRGGSTRCLACDSRAQAAAEARS